MSNSTPRHESFSSIGKDLTEDVFQGKTYRTHRHIGKIVIHCSASPHGRGDDAHTIDRWHKERWGSGIGYHYVVLEDGTIQKGRWADYIGSHAKGHNIGSLAICRIGGMGSDGKPLRDVTDPQLHSLRTLSHLLCSLYGLEPSKIVGHRELSGANKSCPVMNMNLIRNIV